MSERIFYVRAHAPGDSKKTTGFIPSKFLMRNGAYVTDPAGGASQKEPLYSDRAGSNETDGRAANPNNYVIVPANYSEQKAKDAAASLADTLDQHGLSAALGQMTAAFWPGGSEELQRNPRWGIPADSFVPAYTSAASDHFGYVVGAAGLPRELAEFGGGVHNLFSKARSSSKIDASGRFGLSQVNEANIAHGHAAGIAGGQPRTPFDDYGVKDQPSPSPDQIGEGRGISPFSAALSGIDPGEPAPPSWPPQQNDQVRYLSSERVRY